MAENDDEQLFDDLSHQSAPERTSAGAARLRTAERRQVALRAVCLDELVPNDHRVRMVWRFVEGLDLTALLVGIKSVEGRPGHPPADPRILLALWLYATIEGVASARQAARLCGEHIAFQWLCGGVGMNAKTLADFRVGHGAGNCSPPRTHAEVGSAVPARVRRMASRAPMARRRPVSTTERMSA